MNVNELHAGLIVLNLQTVPNVRECKNSKKVLEMTHPKIHDDQPKPRFISESADNVMLTENNWYYQFDKLSFLPTYYLARTIWPTDYLAQNFIILNPWTANSRTRCIRGDLANVALLRRCFWSCIIQSNFRKCFGSLRRSYQPMMIYSDLEMSVRVTFKRKVYTVQTSKIIWGLFLRSISFTGCDSQPCWPILATPCS